MKLESKSKSVRIPDYEAGAAKLAIRYLRCANPDMWDGMSGTMPKTFYCQPIDYRIDDGHTIRIYSEYRDMPFRGMWFVVVEYVVCGMVSARTWVELADVVRSVNLLVHEISGLYDKNVLWLEKFDKESHMTIRHMRPIPVGGTIKYEQYNMVVDCSNIAKLAYHIISTDVGLQYNSLDNELLDVWFFGGDIDFHIALAVNSISDTNCRMHPEIRKWAMEYADGLNFDTYRMKVLGHRDPDNK